MPISFEGNKPDPLAEGIGRWHSDQPSVNPLRYESEPAAEAPRTPPSRPTAPRPQVNVRFTGDESGITDSQPDDEYGEDPAYRELGQDNYDGREGSDGGYGSDGEGPFDDEGEADSGDERKKSHRGLKILVGVVVGAVILGSTAEVTVEHSRHVDALAAMIKRAQSDKNLQQPPEVVADPPVATTAPVHRASPTPTPMPKHTRTAKPSPSTTVSPSSTAVKTPTSSPTATKSTPTTAHVVPPAPSPSAASPEKAEQQCVAALPNELKMAQMVMMGVYGDKLTPKLTEEFSANHVGGVIVMTAPTPAKAGEKNALQRFIDAQKIPPLAATDQEGGKPATDIGAVSRFEVPDSVTLGGYMPTATKVASTMTPAAAEKMYTKNFAYLKSQGINMNFGPVADLIPSSGTNELAGRQYSTDPTKASAYVAANVRAADLADILPVVKHFPGNTMNTDIHSATSKNYADLEKSDLLPFKAAGKTNAAIMIGNMIVPNLTAGQPASLSLAANKAARNLGYDFTITDALNAKAINLPAATAVVKAWEAGNNMALIVGPDKGLTLTKQFMAIDAYANKELKNGNLTQAQINTAFAGVIAEKQEAGINITACDLRAALPSNAADAAGAAAKESSTSSTSAPKVTNPVSTPSATEAAKKVSVSTATPTVAAAKN